jgi:hypothetical protein
MPKKIFVGYETVFSGRSLTEPEFKPKANLKDEAKIAADIEEKREAWHRDLARMPYTAVFKEVRLFDQTTGQVITFKKRGKGRQSAELAIRQWLLKLHPTAWPNTTNPRGVPEVVFVGFHPKLFLKILGIECSLPANQPRLEDGSPDPEQNNALPLSLWYGHSDYRDIEEAVWPKDAGGKTLWDIVFDNRGIKRPEGWNGPGFNAAEDLKLTLEFAGQLGMLLEE